MIEFQEALARIIAPAATDRSLADKAALVEARPGGDDRIVTYGQLDRLIGRAQQAFGDHGVAAGDIVLLCSPNSPELVAAIFATWRLGAIALPVDFRLTRGEIENIAQKVAARVVYAPEPLSDKFETIVASAWPDEPPEFEPSSMNKLDGKARALIILTSGTTGMPKGAVHDLASFINNVAELGGEFGLGEKDCAFLPLPVSHIFGIAVVCAELMYKGCVVFSDFNPADFWACVLRRRATMIVGVPTIYGALLAMPSPPESDLPVEFFLSGGAPLPVSLNEDFQKRFGRRIVQGYGTTETKILCFNKDGPFASVGRTLPSVKVSIVADGGATPDDGQQGEIVVSGPSLMTGYLNQPDVTAEVLVNGQYHTGDIGYLENGYLFISGRSKEMINVAGNKVFPLEVEAVLRQHPLAAEVAVIGVPHSRLGQIVKAVVVVKPSEQAEGLGGDAEQQKAARQELKSKFRAFCDERLKRELRPMDWEFRAPGDPLPKTHTGKIDKKLLS